MASLCSFICRHHLLLFAVVAFAVAFTTNTAAAAANDDTTHLHFYMHDVRSGRNRTAVEVVAGTVPLPSLSGIDFGDLVVIDDPLTEGPELSSKLVGRAQGFYLSVALQEASYFVSANFMLAADGPYNGSTVSVQGHDPVMTPVRELSVVGGSGRFRMARGYVLWKTHSADAATLDAVLELDVYITTK